MRLLHVTLKGYLTEEALRLALQDAEAAQDERAQHALLVDCLDMTGYDRTARDAFVAWNRAHKSRIARVAVVTTNPLYHMVVTAMGLASSQDMKPFKDLERARQWATAVSVG